MGKVIMSGIVPPLMAPVTGIQLRDIAEGSIVKLNENGSPVEFYVAKQDYESALNGAGRTLLVRTTRMDARVWHTSDVNAYAASNMDSYLNGTYKNLFDSDTKSAIGTTKFYYTPGNGTTTVTTLERSIFLPSVSEFGVTKNADYANTEGSTISVVSALITDNTMTWTRTPKRNTTGSVYLAYYLNTGGIKYIGASYKSCSNSYKYFPCFTLPSGALFDEETMLFNGKVA